MVLWPFGKNLPTKTDFSKSKLLVTPILQLHHKRQKQVLERQRVKCQSPTQEYTMWPLDHINKSKNWKIKL